MSNPASLRPFARRDGTSGKDARPFAVRLSPDELAKLDAHAARLGVDRSSAVRGWIATLPEVKS